MRSEHSDLKELFQGYVASKKPASRQGCPSPEDIVRSFEPSAPKRMKKELVDHLSECSYCREEFAIALELRKSGPRPLALQPAGSGPGKLGQPALWQLACLLLGVSLAVSSLVLLVHQRELAETRRTGEAGLGLSFPKPGQKLSGPIVFRWQPTPDSDHYVLELFDEALLPVWTSDKIRDVQIPLPPAISSGLKPGKAYFWMVTAYSGEATLAESDLARFVISPDE